MKRNLLLTLLIALLAIFLCSCSENINENEGKTLTESDYPAFFVDPDSFRGYFAKFPGKIFSDPIVVDDQYGVQIEIDYNGTDNYVVGIYDPGQYDLRSGDYILAEGTIDGTFVGKNMLGGELTYPLMILSSVSESTYIDVESPTILEIVVGETITQHDISITIDKIEFAEAETRIYATIKNESSDQYSFWSYSSKIIQDGSQHDIAYNFDAEYAELPDEILPGAAASGILLFHALDQTSFSLYLEGNSNNWDLEFEPFTFKIVIE